MHNAQDISKLPASLFRHYCHVAAVSHGGDANRYDHTKSFRRIEAEFSACLWREVFSYRGTPALQRDVVISGSGIVISHSVIGVMCGAKLKRRKKEKASRKGKARVIRGKRNGR